MSAHRASVLASHLPPGSPRRAAPSAAARPVIVSLDASEVTLEREMVKGEVEVRCYNAHREEDIPADVSEADIVLVWHTINVTPELLQRLKRARALIRVGAGYNNINVRAAGALGIPVCNVPNYGTEEVADTAMTLALGLCRRTTPMGLAVMQGKMDAFGPDDIAKAAGEHCRRLRGQTFGIVGFGRIGQATARRAQAFGFRVAFYDPYAPDGVDKQVGGAARYESLHGLMGASDVVSLNANAIWEDGGGKKANIKMIDAAALRASKRGQYIVNTARGELVDDAALLTALESGHIAGAGLDVLWMEPYLPHAKDPKPGSSSETFGGARGLKLLQQGRLVCTPHVAWYSADSRTEMRSLSIDNALRALRGEPIRNCVNAHLLTAAPRTPVAGLA